jgi:hypothetical protein
MPARYENGLMKRGRAARQLIREGEDPYRMLLQVVWPERDWAQDALLATLTSCPECSGGRLGCSECGGTGLVTTNRRKTLAYEALADTAYHAA